MNRLEYAIGVAESKYRRVYRRFAHKTAPYHMLNLHRVMHTSAETSEYIASKLVTGKPFLAGRFGSNELEVVSTYIHRTLDAKTAYTAKVVKAMCDVAGFFPYSEQAFDRFGELMLQSASAFDLLGLWIDDFELQIIRKYAPGARGCLLESLEPYYDPPSGWTKALAGKKVLVVHPFEQTIISQYKKRAELFPDGMLPEFELKTIKAVQTLAGERDERFADWFGALDYMKAQVDACDFDVAIIGCGAYGFPLAAHVKAGGKQAIHLGGATQILFGILGNRWMKSEAILKLANESWVRPSGSERPTNAHLAEEACYW